MTGHHRMGRISKFRRVSACVAVLFVASAGVAVAADPTDTSFATGGIAEIEARSPDGEQVGGISDLEPAGGGRLLAAVYPIAREGHFFAAARFRRDGSLDASFGDGGFTPKVGIGRVREEDGEGTLQAEAVAGQRNGDVVLAGYLERQGAFGPALARFTARGALDSSFGSGGKVVRGSRRPKGASSPSANSAATCSTMSQSSPTGRSPRPDRPFPGASSARARSSRRPSPWPIGRMARSIMGLARTGASRSPPRGAAATPASPRSRHFPPASSWSPAMSPDRSSSTALPRRVGRTRASVAATAR